MPLPSDAARIRSAIVANTPGWRKVRSVRLFADEASLKRVPAGLPADHPYADDLRRRSFVASTELTDVRVTASDFVARFLRECERLDPLNAFLAKAVGVPY